MIKLLKRCRIPLAILIIVAAVISSLFRALTPWASQYKAEVEAHLSTLIGEPVHIQTMETGWYWFEPVIKLKQVSVSDGKDAGIHLKKLLVGINVLGSLWHWQIQPGVLYVDDLNLDIRQKDNQWQIEGLNLGNGEFKLDPAVYTPVLAWVLNQQKIIIKHLSTQIHLQNGTVIPVKRFNLVVSRKADRYRIQGEAALEQHIPTAFQLVADLAIDPYQLSKTEGEVYFSSDDLNFEQWSSLLPQNFQQNLKGHGDFKSWIDIKKGQLQTLQSQFNLQQIQWQEMLDKKINTIQKLKANVAWSLTEAGWKLTADDLVLRLNGTKWPKNSFELDYNRQNNAYHAYIKNLNIASVFESFPHQFAARLSSLRPYNPIGFLTNTQLEIKEGQAQSLLTRFSKLGWQNTETVPGVDNFSGVIQWRPTEGRLELDSEDAIIRVEDKPPVKLLLANAAMSWKTANQSTSFDIERLVLQSPDLLLKAKGQLSGLSKESKGQLDFTGEFEGSKAEQWIKYIPSGKLKPKLESWLKQNIKQIDHLMGEVHIHGPLSEFPFDNNNGEFLIKSHLQGIDLYYARHWPITRNIEAYLTVDRRSLNADIVHANLRGIILDKANLRVDDIGHDRETLLLHAKVNSNSKKGLAYVLESPLKNKLSALKMLKMSGDLSMDFRLEAPLYPDNDEILVLGDMDLENNEVTVHHSLDDLQLTGVTGSLQFDQEGVLDSNLKASLLHNPVSILIKSVRQEKPYTEVKVKGKTSIDLLKDKLDLPLFSLMQGELWIESTLILTAEPSDLDHLQIKTNLQGVNVNLPAPFGKTSMSKAPLSLDIQFNPDKAVKLKMDYDKRLSANLIFAGKKKEFQLEKGSILFGNGRADDKVKGLQIAGSLPAFNLQEWQQIFSQSTSNNKGISGLISFININLKKAIAGSYEYDNLTIKARKTPEETWAIRINQKTMDANLNYDPKFNLLKGHFDRLILGQNKRVNAAKATHLNIADMPNLELDIKDLRFIDWRLGKMSLKAISTRAGWKIDSCSLKSPAYQINAKGLWASDQNGSKTDIQSRIEITDIAKGLEQFNISPAVEGHEGLIRLSGSWPGGFQDFSLDNLTGNMSIELKNGRITHLSSDTEEKLGLGKLLSILSLQTIPRRLKLDFSDLSNDGYSFDIFEGNFAIAQGMMTTQDSYIDGPIAYASMKGNLDISRQLYNLNLRVTPHITASLPIVATIAGGPVVGLATWVASKIINQGMQKVSGYTYKISGPWKQPEVAQDKIFRKKKKQA
ncbi:transmembrane protein [Legionella birminghamensis]|uniref:Transmembrane protein n=1 Tax=Legionella birminghamensis TaxID=28083 RepID=A0A378IC45_9GAMM|nr:YhdP family protein [Legionella birminghamensis]KTC73088.1 transmembrane protein [Legionella birminghamensis]STX32335.1 transmembrane protein [Legionella birminghamensis]